jgi:hypothetical protein
MSRNSFPLFAVALCVLLIAGEASAQGFGGKSKALPLTGDSITKARDKAIRAYGFQTEFPGASDEERRVARAAPMKVPDEIKPDDRKPSEWWARIGKILGPVMRVTGWMLLTAIVLGLLYYAANVSGGWRFRRKEKPDGTQDNMAPVVFDGKTVQDWLQQAESMAAQGRFAEAVHFLLFSSFDDIRRRLNAVLRPAWTSREILRDVPMRTSATAALNVLVDTVEESEFAGRAISAQDFTRCRDTYARFVAEVAA